MSLTDLKSITNGSLILNLNGADNEFSGINLSSANSLTNVASLISSAITNNLVVCEYDEIVIVKSRQALQKYDKVNGFMLYSYSSLFEEDAADALHLYFYAL